MKVYSTAGLMGKRVVCGPKRKRLGKVHWFIMHPTECKVIGFTVKRPDAALMFHRKDVFVKVSDFSYDDDELLVTGKTFAADVEAGKACGVNWNDCVMWWGMPLTSESGELVGYVANVRFEEQSGQIVSVTAGKGSATDLVLGKRTLPASMVLGFRRGTVGGLVQSYQQLNDLDSEQRGAILVSDEALEISAEGGVAAAAGKATAVVTHKVKEGTAKTKVTVQQKVDEMKPAAQKAAQKTDEMANKGAYALGKQLGKASGMFAAFKEEYQKGLEEDDADEQAGSEGKRS